MLLVIELPEKVGESLAELVLHLPRFEHLCEEPPRLLGAASPHALVALERRHELRGRRPPLEQTFHHARREPWSQNTNGA